MYFDFKYKKNTLNIGISFRILFLRDIYCIFILLLKTNIYSSQANIIVYGMCTKSVEAVSKYIEERSCA